MRRVRVLAASAVLVVFLFILPTLDLPTFGILPSSTGMPGSLRLLAIVVITAALAVTFDLLLGQTGLLSFGHAVYFAGGSYVFAMMLNYTSLSFWAAASLAVVAVFAASLMLGMVSLRVDGLAYAMVTLAFLELVSVMVTRGYFGTNGESGLRLPSEKIPENFIGIRNVSNVYSLAVVVSVVVIASAVLLTRTRFGLILRGMRDNPLRMRVMGYDVYWTKLVIMAVSSGMAALCGVAYTIILSGADPTTTTMTFSLSLMFMVVIGGSGSVAGAAVGGAVYALLLQRLPALGDSVAGSGPAVVSDIVREPQLLLGVIFLAVVFLAPAGIRGLVSRARAGLATAARTARPPRPRADASH
ncbi:branched-chain amino acid ABC transporter permease [Streptomyces sp. NPDC050625]|uniref:branched-chain amino acid ABC transporter permease n=1 Tax=Streptomyces sp. NPDC050625 TaxID=3154629 RepID=UPI003424039E